MSKITEGRHKDGCNCGFCQNMNKLRKGKSDGGDKADDKPKEDKEKNESRRAARIVSKLLDS